MERKLASIQVIEKVSPIEGADAIEVAKVLGWHVVIRKGEFKEGDSVIYCEIDSVLPDKPEFEFLRARKFRIKTIKLKGQVSQGICFPVSLLTKGKSYKIGDDVTEEMGIEKYEMPIPANLMGHVIGEFPSFMPKTDETRVQLLKGVLERLRGTPCYATEKLDGTSATFFIKDGVFGVCSRNLNLKETEDNVHWQMARKYKIEEALRLFGRDVAIQGEIVGFGVQTNSLKLRDKRFYAYQLFDIDSYQYYARSFFQEFCEKHGILAVPVVEEYVCLHTEIDDWVKMADGESRIGKGCLREGIVVRPYSEMVDMQMAQGFGNGRVSFKVVSPQYLLKHNL